MPDSLNNRYNCFFISHMTSPNFVILTALVVSFWASSGCSNSSKKDSPNQIDGKLAIQGVKELVNIGPRPSGSQNAKKTADFLFSKCMELGYNPELDEWTEQTSHGKMTFRNVYATLNGKGSEFLILGSHFDTKKMTNNSNFVGANDSGSSTALLLEIMRVLKKGKYKRHGPSIRFSFFDGEEAIIKYGDNDGLHGSKRFAKKIKDTGEHTQCKGMILLDMVGDKDLTITLSPDNDSNLINHLFTVAEQQKTREYFGFFLHGSIIDDHVPFQKLKIPTLNLIDFNYGPNNYYWHNEQDTVDKLSAESMEIVGNAVLQLISEL